MATSVSVAISRDLTGFGLEPSHPRKGAGWEPSPGGSWAGVTALSPPSHARFGAPPSYIPRSLPRHRQVRWSHSVGAAASALKLEPAGVVPHASPQDEAEAGFRAAAVS